MIGIYKITNPSGRLYIGQSINIERRKKEHSIDCNSNRHPRLSKSIKKYGFENHSFDIIEECAIEKLNERERYWQDFYNAISKTNLNCKLTTINDKKGCLSEETKAKISIGLLNRVNYKVSDKHKEILSKIHKNKIVSLETREKQRNKKIGGTLSVEHKLKIKEKMNGRIFSNDHIINMINNHPRSIKVVDENNVVYNSIRQMTIIKNCTKKHILDCIARNIYKTV